MLLGDKIRAWVESTEIKQDPNTGGNPDDEYVNQKRMGMYVGLVAFLLAPVMFLKWAFFQGCFYDSISHFYYSRYTGDMLVGALVFIAVFLFAYNGRFTVEYWMAKFAGGGALLIAWFPTSGTGCEGRPEINGRGFFSLSTDAGGAIEQDILIGKGPFPVDGQPALPSPAFELFGEQFRIPILDAAVQVETFHFLGAALLFGTLTFFCFFVFTIPRAGEVKPTARSDGKPDLRDGKKNRNRIYKTCGWFMAAAIGGIVAHAVGLIPTEYWNANNLMYWMEFVILTFFAIAWWTKGRFDFWKNSAIGDHFERRFIDREAQAEARPGVTHRGL